MTKNIQKARAVTQQLKEMTPVSKWYGVLKYLATSPTSLVKPKAHMSTTEMAEDTARPYTCTQKVQGSKPRHDTYCPN